MFTELLYLYVFQCGLTLIDAHAALQYKDLANPGSAPSARPQMILTSMVKSPEHQQVPGSLVPSNSGRRKEAATPEGEPPRRQPHTDDTHWR